MAQMMVAGEHCDAATQATREIRNPATGELVDHAPEAAAIDVERAVGAAEAAFRSWAATPPARRAEVLQAAAHELRNREQDLARLLTAEQGKPLREAVLEIRRFQHTIEHYAGMAKAIRGGAVSALDERRRGLILKRPIGVCAAILPWNFPLSLMGNKIGPALSAGNTVVVKPAGSTPLATLAAVRAFHDAGLPPGVLNVVSGSATVVGEALLTDPRVRKIGFTGSTETGKRVMAAAARDIKRVTLELGGSDPMIVCDDADIPQAVSAAAVGRFFNCGQACLAVKRLFLFESIYDEFVAMLVDKVRRLRIGNGLDPGVTIGPLHSARQREEIESQIDDAVARGAVVLAGGARPQGNAYAQGHFYTPTLLGDVAAASRVMNEETFGPVLPIVRVSSIEEAIGKANASIYGLGSSVWTRSLERAIQAYERLDAGYTWVNSPPIVFDELPFGGLKQSGLGKEHGLEALDYYMETKSVVVAADFGG